MSKRMLLLINPNAGKSGYKAHIAGILAVFCAAGWEPTVFFTVGDERDFETVSNGAREYDMVTCLGGDGTLSEVVSGMMQAEKSCPIGYIPLGTANDVARTLGISSRPVDAARQIMRGRPFSYDVGQFGTNDFFTYIAAFGAFTEVSYGTPQERKHALGHMAYMLEGIKSLSKISPQHAIIEYDDGVVEGDFLFGAVTNSTSVAGLVRLDGSMVDLSDGVFELLLVKNPQDIVDLNEIVTAVASSNFTGENVIYLRSREVRLMFDRPVAWTRDGEDGGRHRDVFIVNRHPGVEIIV